MALSNAITQFRMMAARIVWTMRVVLSAEEFFAAMARAAHVNPASNGKDLHEVLFGKDRYNEIAMEYKWYMLGEAILMDGSAPTVVRIAFKEGMRDDPEVSPGIVKEQWQRLCKEITAYEVPKQSK